MRCQKRGGGCEILLHHACSGKHEIISLLTNLEQTEQQKYPPHNNLPSKHILASHNAEFLCLPCLQNFSKAVQAYVTVGDEGGAGGDAGLDACTGTPSRRSPRKHPASAGKKSIFDIL